MTALPPQAESDKPPRLRWGTRLAFGFLIPLLCQAAAWFPLLLCLIVMLVPDPNAREAPAAVILSFFMTGLLLLGLLGSLILSLLGRWTTRGRLFRISLAVAFAPCLLVFLGLIIYFRLLHPGTQPP